MLLAFLVTDGAAGIANAVPTGTGSTFTLMSTTALDATHGVALSAVESPHGLTLAAGSTTTANTAPWATVLVAVGILGAPAFVNDSTESVGLGTRISGSGGPGSVYRFQFKYGSTAPGIAGLAALIGNTYNTVTYGSLGGFRAILYATTTPTGGVGGLHTSDYDNNGSSGICPITAVTFSQPSTRLLVVQFTVASGTDNWGGGGGLGAYVRNMFAQVWGSGGAVTLGTGDYDPYGGAGTGTSPPMWNPGIAWASLPTAIAVSFP
jgi:hypothetical protein